MANYDKLRRNWEHSWDPSIEEMGNKQVSFGTAGVINTLVKCSNDPPGIKKNILLINGSTLIRNAMNREVQGRPVLESDLQRVLSDDVNQLRTYFEMYSSEKSFMIVYFHPTIYKLIPETSRRNLTIGRETNIKLTNIVSRSDKLPTNKLLQLSQDQWLTTYGVTIDRSFSHQVIPRLISGDLASLSPRVILVSHCAMDYLMMDKFRNMELIDSHTGKITERKSLGIKVWKTDEIPFNPTTLKLFGDSDYIQPLVKQRPAALRSLGPIKLKTEMEIHRLAIQQLKIDRKMLDWKL